jgi:hypothetical protein
MIAVLLAIPSFGPSEVSPYYALDFSAAITNHATRSVR